MRVVAGTARGRRLVVPPGSDVRPTSDRVREATFNALTSLGAVEGARVLDLFAGTGALGIEALSRGAEAAVFVEAAKPALRALQTNIDTLGMAARSRTVPGTAEAFLQRAAQSGETFDLVLCDPPYRFDDWTALLGLVAPCLSSGGLVVLESARSIALPADWEVAREKVYGGTVVCLACHPTQSDRTAPLRSHT